MKKLFLTLSLLAASSACQRHEQAGSPDSYVENGVAWAFGSVQLSHPDAPGTVMIKRLAPVNGVDTPNTQIRMFGAVMAQATQAAGEREIAYVDFHPTSPRLLAFNYYVEARMRADGRTSDVFAVLRKPGRSYYGRQNVWLGTAYFQPGVDAATLAPAEGLKLSLIANGVFAGQWALHYPVVELVVGTPWQGVCPKTVVQAPGQTPGQNPGQYETCKPLPPMVDLCEGQPAKDGCRPKRPVQAPLTGGMVRAPRLISGIELVANEKDVYEMPADLKEGKIIFVQPGVAAADDATNAAYCAKRFIAVARTVDGVVNDACMIKPAPASPQDGKQACAVSVTFDRAETYLEKACNITAIFRGQGGLKETVQVLKR